MNANELIPMEELNPGAAALAPASAEMQIQTRNLLESTQHLNRLSKLAAKYANSSMIPQNFQNVSTLRDGVICDEL